MRFVFFINLFFGLLCIAGQPLFSSSDYVPVIEEVEGGVIAFSTDTRQPLPVQPGLSLSGPTLLRMEQGSSLIFSCPVGIAGRITGPAEFILGPPTENRYEAELRRGTMAVLLDPDRPKDSPQFAIRTADGVALAKGTFYAVTEYKGQSYVKVKKGEVKTKPKPPGMPNFSAYLKKSKVPKPLSKK